MYSYALHLKYIINIINIGIYIVIVLSELNWLNLQLNKNYAKLNAMNNTSFQKFGNFMNVVNGLN